MQFLPAGRGDNSVRRAVVAIALASACVSCRAEASASEIENLLQQHSEILYRIIRKHPAEMIAALNKAAQIAQMQTQKNALRDAGAKTADEFRNPEVPFLQHRIAFGNASAPITIVEYSDFQCRYCRRERDVLVEVMRPLPVRIRPRHSSCTMCCSTIRPNRKRKVRCTLGRRFVQWGLTWSARKWTRSRPRFAPSLMQILMRAGGLGFWVRLVFW